MQMYNSMMSMPMDGMNSGFNSFNTGQQQLNQEMINPNNNTSTNTNSNMNNIMNSNLNMNPNNMNPNSNMNQNYQRIKG